MAGAAKLLTIAALFFAAAPSEADTLTTGVLSPDTVRLLCKREDARFRDFGADGYGCHTATFTISCRPTLDCVTRKKDLDPYLGGGTNIYLQQHGETRFERVDID